MTAVDRVLMVLWALGEQGNISPKKLAEQVGLPLSTLYRYLNKFQEYGFASKDEVSGFYTVGSRLALLAHVPHVYQEFISLARQHLEQLQRRAGELVYLVSRVGTEALCLDVVEANERLQLTMRKGEMLPLHASAPCKVLLAFSPSDFRQRFIGSARLERFTSNTIVDAKTLETELAQIVANGYATSVAELDEMASAVAVPVSPDESRLEFAIAIAGPTARLHKKKTQFLVQMLQDCADAVSRQYATHLASLEIRNPGRGVEL